MSDHTDSPSQPLGSDTMRLVIRARSLGATGEAKRLREHAHLTLREMGDLVGASASAVQTWETGHRRPRGAAAVRYGRVLTEIETALSEAL